MQKRRKVLVFLGLIALAAVCFVILTPRDEPKYQDVYLSEWLRRYTESDAESQEETEARNAICAIGTNALPFMLKWISYHPSAWQTNLYLKLPDWITDNETIDKWFDLRVNRAEASCSGFEALGTNAVGAIPQLVTIMNETNKPAAVRFAMLALVYVGEPAIPALRKGLFDLTLKDHTSFIVVLGHISVNGYSNTCLPILQEALKREEIMPREFLTNVVDAISANASGRPVIY